MTLSTIVALIVVSLVVAGAGAAPAKLPQQTGSVSVPWDANLELRGANTYDTAGTSVAAIGDVNGDGLADVLVGAPGASNNGRRESGSVYVVFGQRLPGTVDLGALGAAGFRIDGANPDDSVGSSVAPAGDVNGDGRADFLIGAPDMDSNGRYSSGSVYVVFGKTSTTNVDLASLGDGGFRIDGATAYDYAGSSVAPTGDVNGDGRADLLVGAPDTDANGRYSSGSAYVVYGKTSTTNVDLGSLGDGGFRIDGANSYDHAGTSVAAAGDANGDGRADFLVGAPDMDSNDRYGSGSVYVVYGKTSATNIDLGSLGDGGFRIDGANAYDSAGTSVAPAGDVNGDGRPDFLLGASGASNNGRRSSGSAYVVFGRAEPGNVDLASLGAGGFRMDGANSLDAAGTSIAAAGDVNGDGRPDLLVGTTKSAAYLVFGRESAVTVDLAALNPGGIVITGYAGDSVVAGDHTGRSVAGAGDVNGDGRPDILIGAPWAAYRDVYYAGEAHVIYGFGSPEVSYDSFAGVAGRPALPLSPKLVRRTGPARFAVTPPLPAGLKIDPASGMISGTPATSEQRTTYTVTMQDLAGTARAQLVVTIRDETAPALRLRAPEPQHAIRQGGVLVRASCSEACTLRASGTVTAAGLRAVFGLKAAQATLRSDGAATLKLGFSSGAKIRLERSLRQGRHSRAIVTVRAVDRAGNVSSATRTISLTT